MVKVEEVSADAHHVVSEFGCMAIILAVSVLCAGFIVYLRIADSTDQIIRTMNRNTKERIEALETENEKLREAIFEVEF